MKVNGEYIVMFKHPYANRNEMRIETFKGICENFTSGSNGLCVFVDAENRMLLVNYHDIVQMKPVKKNKSMINLPLSNKEWYFLHIQLESIIKENPNNHIAKDLFEKLVYNMPKLNDIKNSFKKEYDSIWRCDVENEGNEK